MLGFVLVFAVLLVVGSYYGRLTSRQVGLWVLAMALTSGLLKLLNAEPAYFVIELGMFVCLLFFTIVEGSKK